MVGLRGVLGLRPPDSSAPPAEFMHWGALLLPGDGRLGLVPTGQQNAAPVSQGSPARALLQHLKMGFLIERPQHALNHSGPSLEVGDSGAISWWRYKGSFPESSGPECNWQREHPGLARGAGDCCFRMAFRAHLPPPRIVSL